MSCYDQNMCSQWVVEMGFQRCVVVSAAIVAVGHWVLGAIGYRSIVTASEVIELACRLGKAEAPSNAAQCRVLCAKCVTERRKSVWHMF